MKKKIWLIILIIAAVIITAIGAVYFIYRTSNKIYIPASYSMDFSLDSDIGEVSGSIEKGKDEISISFDSPLLLNGLKIDLSEDEYSFYYHNISVEQSAVPSFAEEYVSNLFAILNEMQYISIERSPGEYSVAEYNIGNVNSKFYFDNKTDYPVKIEVSGLGTINISNFSIIK